MGTVNQKSTIDVHRKMEKESKHKDDIKTSNLENENINAAYKEKKKRKERNPQTTLKLVWK